MQLVPLHLGGITTDVCVHTTMREANDLGYECLLLEDGTAATDRGNHEAAIKMVHMQGGVFGATAAVDAVVKAFDALPRPADTKCAKVGEAMRVATMAAGKRHGAGAVPAATPSAFAWPAAAAALIMVDWQKDFCHPDGFGASLGNDVAPLIAAVPAAAKVLAAARAACMPVIHTLEAHLPDLSDCPPSKMRRCPSIGQTLVDSSGSSGGAGGGGSSGKRLNGRVLVRDEPGNSLIEELTDQPGEKIIHKPGKGAFFGTDLDAHLKSLGVTHLIFTVGTPSRLNPVEIRSLKAPGLVSSTLVEAIK
jgi:nicotinamidase-related amidase